MKNRIAIINIENIAKDKLIPSPELIASEPLGVTSKIPYPAAQSDPSQQKATHSYSPN